MKTIFTLATSLFMGLSVFATDAKQKSSLTIQSSGSGDIRVVLDGKRFEPGTNKIMISDINAGYHQVKIYREKNTGFFSILGRRYEVVFNNSLNVRPGTMLRMTIDRFGRATMDETRFGRGRFDRDQRDDPDYGRDGQYGSDRDFDYDQDGQWGDYDTHYGHESSMSDRDFSRVLQSVSKEWLESNKLKSATQVVTTQRLTSAQVKQLVLLFNFESNKLDLAKAAYNNTVDKRNYSMLNDVFSFNSSKDELARFVRSYK